MSTAHGLPALGVPLSPLPNQPEEDDIAHEEWRAARQEATDRWLRATEFLSALKKARLGRLQRDWREQGLSRQLESEHGHVWVWMKIQGVPVRSWEPGVTYTMCADPAVPLTHWYQDMVAFRREQEDSLETSFSREVGFNVVDTSEEEWEALLDSHREPWPASIRDYVGRSHNVGLRAHSFLTTLHRVHLSYQVGMAEAGYDIDWIAQHRQRVSRWRLSADRRSELAWLDRAEQLGHIPAVYRLPADWSCGLPRV
ncbi:MAG: hypothetical protein E6R06_24350 [Mycobacterium sp.]|nr:MAG: hypothetical protein E6R06_24350 [Mycobacterium sp.]